MSPDEVMNSHKAIKEMYVQVWRLLKQQDAQNLRVADKHTLAMSDEMIRSLVIPPLQSKEEALDVLRRFPKRATLEFLRVTTCKCGLGQLTKAVMMDPGPVSTVMSGVRELVICGYGSNLTCEDITRVCLLCPLLSSFCIEPIDAEYVEEVPSFNSSSLVPLKYLKGLRKLSLTMGEHLSGDHDQGAELLGVSVLTGLSFLRIREANRWYRDEICAAVSCIRALEHLDLQFSTKREFNKPWDKFNKRWDERDYTSALSGLTQLTCLHVDGLAIMNTEEEEDARRC